MTDADAVAAKLVARMNTLAVGGQSNWAVGTQVFTGRPRPEDTGGGANAVPVEAIFVFVHGGRRGTQYRGGTDADATVMEGGRFPDLRVWVRGKPRDRDRPATLAEGVYLALQCQPPAGFYECIALGSGAQFIREDDAGREEWLVSFELKKEF